MKRSLLLLAAAVAVVAFAVQASLPSLFLNHAAKLKDAQSLKAKVLVDEVGGDPAEIPYLRYVRSWMGVPLALKDRVIGVIALGHSRPGYYTPHHAELVTAMASQAAVAIENARLHQQALQVAALEERQRLARELHDSVSQALYGIALGARTARTQLDRDPAKSAEPLEYVLSLAEGCEDRGPQRLKLEISVTGGDRQLAMIGHQKIARHDARGKAERGVDVGHTGGELSQRRDDRHGGFAIAPGRQAETRFAGDLPKAGGIVRRPHRIELAGGIDHGEPTARAHRRCRWRFLIRWCALDSVDHRADCVARHRGTQRDHARLAHPSPDR